MDSLENEMERLKIYERDLDERFVLGSGSGGQKINKTSSCVYLKHRPSGVEVSCQETRSREKNREIARRRLCEHFAREERLIQLRKARSLAKKRYQKRRPSLAQRARQRETKVRRSEKKRFRAPIRD